MAKVKILGAYAEKCEHCNGIVYKLLTSSLGIIYQCKCGATYQNR